MTEWYLSRLHNRDPLVRLRTKSLTLLAIALIGYALFGVTAIVL